MSTWLFSDYLDAVAPHLPPAVLAPDQMAIMREQLTAIPGHLTRSFLFECRLDANEAQVDVEFIVDRQRQQLLSACDTTLFEHPIWQRVRQFAQLWADPNHPALASVSHIWLGFDFDTVAQLPLPVLYICTEHLTKAQIVDLLATLEQPISDKFVACLTAAPHAPWMIGVMFARRTEAIRFILPLPTAQAWPFLTEIGWDAQDKSAEKFLSQLEKTTAEIGVSLDIGPTIKPRLGLEYLYSRRQTSTVHNWQQHLTQLCDWGLCSAEKQDAFLQFPGLLHEKQANRHWADALRSPNGSQQVSLIERSLSHLKLIITPDQPPTAKGYLHVEHGWLQLPQGA